MPTFYSPEGNSEVWDKKPDGYITVDEYVALQEAEYNTLENVAARKLVEIDEQTSMTILNGFMYNIDDVDYHFSYDAFDQQNFSDSANMANIIKAGGTSTITTVFWNAYKDWDGEKGTLVRIELDVDKFLDLYVNGALLHKSTIMAEGGDRKDALAVAVANKVPLDEIEVI